MSAFVADPGGLLTKPLFESHCVGRVPLSVSRQVALLVQPPLQAGQLLPRKVGFLLQVMQISHHVLGGLKQLRKVTVRRFCRAPLSELRKEAKADCNL